jgi:Tfp pilus assembly protein PilP
MKLTTGILILGLAAAAWAQNPDEIQNARDTMRAVQQKKQTDSDAALGGQSTTQPASVQAQSGASHSGPQSATGGMKTVAVPRTEQAAQTSSRHGKSKTKVVAISKPHQPKQRVAVESNNNAASPEKPKTLNLTDRRDPFISPVVNRAMVGSGCSTGKRCLAIDQIALKGVVRSEVGMIAVVVNALDKAYFLRENDPVFNGYVVKITGDSIIFKETVQDKLGKPFTREVTKKITTPAV